MPKHIQKHQITTNLALYRGSCISPSSPITIYTENGSPMHVGSIDVLPLFSSTSNIPIVFYVPKISLRLRSDQGFGEGKENGYGKGR